MKPKSSTTLCSDFTTTFLSVITFMHMFIKSSDPKLSMLQCMYSLVSSVNATPFDILENAPIESSYFAILGMILKSGPGHLMFSTIVGFATNSGTKAEDAIAKDKYLLTVKSLNALKRPCCFAFRMPFLNFALFECLDAW